MEAETGFGKTTWWERFLEPNVNQVRSHSSSILGRIGVVVRLVTPNSQILPDSLSIRGGRDSRQFPKPHLNLQPRSRKHRHHGLKPSGAGEREFLSRVNTE